MTDSEKGLTLSKMTYDEANKAVSAAIFEANNAIDAAICAYDRVHEAECNIARFFTRADAPAGFSSDVAITHRGIGAASIKLAILRSIARK